MKDKATMPEAVEELKRILSEAIGENAPYPTSEEIEKHRQRRELKNRLRDVMHRNSRKEHHAN